MKMCDQHWVDLRAAIDERGMSHLVARSGVQAAEIVQHQLSSGGDCDSKRWDPLMSCCFAFMTRALECGGLYLLTSDEQGNEYCPLCEAEKSGGPGCAARWLGDCTDAALEYARASGLVPRLQ